MRFAALALIAALAAAPAAAGPWPREKGEGFLAFSAARDRHEVYGERGLGRGWTATAKLAFSHRPEPELAEEVLALLWRPLHLGPGGAVSLGLGAGVRSPGPGRAPQPLATAALAWGRGLGGPLSPWVAAEAAIERGEGQHAAKLDLTIGARPGGRRLTMAQVQAFRPGGGPTQTRLELTGGVRVGQLHVLAQPSVALAGPRETRLRVSLWAEF